MTTRTLLTAAEAADRLRTSTRSLYRELESGRLRGSKPRGRWLISESAIGEYLTKHSNQQPDEQPKRRRRRRR